MQPRRASDTAIEPLSTVSRRLAERVVVEEAAAMQGNGQAKQPGMPDSGTPATQPGSIFSLDARVIAWARQQGWAAMATAVVSADKVAKERSAAIGPGFAPPLRIVLEFLGAYRKLVLEYMIQTFGGRIDPAPYASFLRSAGKASVLDAVDSIALGSTRLTSDYDLTLAGPAVHRIMLAAVEQMRTQTRSTSSFLFDSNLYIAPDLIVCPFVEQRLAEMAASASPIRVLASPFRPGRATPVPPQSEAYVAEERESILQKIGKDDAHLTEEAIMDRYRKLAAAGDRLDRMLYRDAGAPSARGKGAPTAAGATASEYFRTLLEMNRLGMEAYHGLSTILMVVNGMQAGQADQVNALLGRGHMLNAALENVVDLNNHWGPAGTEAGSAAKAAKAAKVAKVAKYAARIVHCLDAAGVASELKERLRDPSALLGILEADRGALRMAGELNIPV